MMNSSGLQFTLPAGNVQHTAGVRAGSARRPLSADSGAEKDVMQRGAVTAGLVVRGGLVVSTHYAEQKPLDGVFPPMIVATIHTIAA
ncbi:MAG: hypothetical protein EA384_14260 [Spirochaetaceae bacterium]|nr:MAG: hypothetical protein EA384_14260 [Spirochaetaceae bacterium]